MSGRDVLRKVFRALLLAADLAPGAALAMAGAALIGTGIAWM